MSMQAERPTGLGRPLREVLDRIERQPDRHLGRSALFLAAPGGVPDGLAGLVLDLLATAYPDATVAVVHESTDEGRVVRLGGSTPTDPREVFAALDDVFPLACSPAPKNASRRPALVARVALHRGDLGLAVWREAEAFSVAERLRFIAIRAVAAFSAGHQL